MNDLNLLERLTDSEQAYREYVLGRWLIVIVFFSALLVCVAFPILLEALLSSWIPLSSFWVCVLGVGIGVIYSLTVIPCVFFALLDAPWGIRVVGVIAAIGASLSCISLGMLISGDPDFDLEWLAKFGLPVLPAFAASVALPFVVARYFLGWQIVIQSRNRVPQRQKVSISGLMIGTFVVAICLVGVNSSQLPGLAAAVCAVTVGVGFVFLTPFAYWMLRSPNYWSILGMVAPGVFAIGSVYMFVESIFRSRPIKFGMMWSYSFQWTAAVIWLGLGLIAIRLLCGKLILHRDFDSLNSKSRNVGSK